jgi:hypothetical protein
MSHEPGTYLGGIRDLDSLKGRCWCDPDTKCWHFRTARGRPMKPDGKRQAVWITGRGAMPVTRVAWEFAHGRSVPKGQVAYRTCTSFDCCNPRHIAAGPRAAMGAVIAAHGRYKGKANRIIANRRNGAKRQLLTTELRGWIVESTQSGPEIAHGLGVGPSIVYRVRDNARKTLQRAANSVFAFAQAANQERRAA